MSVNWAALDWRDYGALAIRICAAANAFSDLAGQAVFGSFGGDALPEILLCQTGTHVRLSAVEHPSSDALRQLASYLQLNKANRVITDSPAVRDFLSGTFSDCTSCALMCYTGDAPFSNPPERGWIDTPESLLPVYRLLCDALPGFSQKTTPEQWLVDFSHRCRRNLAQCEIYCVGEHIVSTCAITYRHFGGAILGNVATLPAYRGCGYASALLRDISVRCHSQGLTLFLSTTSPTFYARLGFEKCAALYDLH